MKKNFYYKVILRDQDYPERFYRVFYVKQGINLEEFDAAIQTLLFTAAYHLSEFEDEHNKYVNRFVDDLFPNDLFEYETPLERLISKNLNEKSAKLNFFYDLSSNREFDVEIDLSEERSFYSNQVAILIEGKGQMIFEDSHSIFYEYMDGKDLSYLEGYKPINFYEVLDDVDYSYFDEPLDIVKINAEFNHYYRLVLNAYKKG